MPLTPFHEIRFPERVARGAQGGPRFRTTIVATAGGFEHRNVDWAHERGEWTVAQEIKDEAEFQELKAFFIGRRGRAFGFRFKDWADYRAVAQPVIAGQLYRRYDDGLIQIDKMIVKPVPGTVVLTGGGVLDYTTGLVAGGAPTAWDGEFDLPVRFDTDAMASTLVAYQIHSWSGISLVELRPQEVV